MRISLYVIVEYLISRSVNEREMKDFDAKKGKLNKNDKPNMTLRKNKI